MRVLVIGGHMGPALSIIEALPSSTAVLYVGRTVAQEGEQITSLEYQAVTKRNIPFTGITTGRLQRKWTRHTLPSLLKLPVGVFQAWNILRSFKPTVILGFGGYVQIPLCIVGKLMGIPILIHEQTFQAGLANRITAAFATKVCISWESSRAFFPGKKTVLTGNPAVSNLFTKHFPPVSSPSPVILVLGGSQGSHAINKLISSCLFEILTSYFLIHQTGDTKEFNDYQHLVRQKEKLPASLQQKYTLEKYFDPAEVPSRIHSADIVISRAGVNTVTMLLILNKPSLLIPLPISQKNEQMQNAVMFTRHGLGEILVQETLSSTSFLSAIHAMIKARSEYTNKKNPAELSIHKTAADNILSLLSYVQTIKKSPA